MDSDDSMHARKADFQAAVFLWMLSTLEPVPTLDAGMSLSAVALILITRASNFNWDQRAAGAEPVAA